MKVVWAEMAKRNLDDIFSYIAHDNPTAAERVAEAIVDAADSLERWPRRYAARAGGLRTMPIEGTPYLIRYIVSETKGDRPYVVVISVRHGRQLL